MPYTLWHCGVLIGETDFSNKGRRRNNWADVFRPSSYGVQLFPRLTGMLTAAADLKDELKRRGLVDPPSQDSAAPDLFESTPAGRKVVDIGRTLSEVEIRDAKGVRVEFASIAFMDLAELDVLSRRLGTRSTDEPDFGASPEAPRYIVSATFRVRRQSNDNVNTMDRTRPGGNN